MTSGTVYNPEPAGWSDTSDLVEQFNDTALAPPVSAASPSIATSTSRF
jgi:hypothetical protein